MSVTSTRVVISAATAEFAECVRTVYIYTVTLDLRHKHVLAAAIDHRLQFMLNTYIIITTPSINKAYK